MTILQIITFALLAFPMQNSAPSGSVRGIVRRADTGGPLSGATVQLRRVDGSSPQVYPTTSAADGSFQVVNVRPGEYRVLATYAGFLSSLYGQRRVGGPGISVNVSAGRIVEGIEMTVTPAGVISGRISDLQGDPMGAVEVRAMTSSYQNGKRVLKQVQVATTNDLGEYRLFGLGPGSYFLCVAPSDRALAIQAQIFNISTPQDDVVMFMPPSAGSPNVPIYYPGTSEARSATAIELAAGAHLSGFDISVAPLKTYHVRGRVPGGGAHVSLTPLDPLAEVGRSPHTADATDGSFDIGSVVPGTYLVIARSGDLNGSVRIDVSNGDVDNVIVTLGTGVVIPVQVSFDDHAQLENDPNYEFVHLQLSPDPAIPGVRADTYVPFENGKLGFEVMVGGSYRVTLAPSYGTPPDLRNAYIKSIRMRDRDVLNEGLQYNGEADAKIEVVIGTRPGSLTGSVTGLINGRMQPVINATVALVPDAATRHWTGAYQTATSDASGRFQIQLVPPGDYSVFAWDDVESGAWEDPDFLKLYEARGTRVHINDASQQSISIAVLPAP